MEYQFKEIKYILDYGWTKDKLLKNQKVYNYYVEKHKRKMLIFNDLQNHLNVELPKSWLIMMCDDINCIEILNAKRKYSKIIKAMVNSGYYEYCCYNYIGNPIFIKLKNQILNYDNYEEIIKKRNQSFKNISKKIENSLSIIEL